MTMYRVKKFTQYTLKYFLAPLPLNKEIQIEYTGVKVIFCYTSNDSEMYNIPEIANLLEQKDRIDEVYYWDRDATGSVIDYMNETVTKVDTCVFFYSQYTDVKSGVRIERDMAVYQDKHIIPIFKEINHVPPIIQFNSGCNALGKSSLEIVAKIYNLISKKFHFTCDYSSPFS